MSERSESALEAYHREWWEDLQRNGFRPGNWWSLSESSAKLQKMEADFYRNPKRTQKAQAAMDAAVLAMEKALDRDKKRSMSSNIIPFESIKPELERIRSMSQTVQQHPVQELQTRLNQNHSVQPFYPTQADWNMMLSWGETAFRSGMLPSAIKSKEAAAIIALKGRELGLPYMVAVAHIHVINGKPSMSAEMMQTLARKNLPGLVINFLKSDNTCAEIEFLRPEKGSKAFVSKFTLEDATKAKLMGKDVWQQYPAAMLFSRAISAGLRKVCPEALMGVSYTPEELGASVDQEGNVIETTGRAVQSSPDPQPEAKPEQPKQAPPTVTTGPSQKQIARLFAIAKDRGMSSKEEVKEWIINTFNFRDDFSLTNLSGQEYQDVCDQLEKMPKPIPVQPGDFGYEDPRMVK